MLSAYGFYLARKAPANWIVGLYGCLIFFIGFVPLIGQGGYMAVLEGYGSLRYPIYEYCQTPEAELLELLVEKEDSDHTIIAPFIEMAEELDSYS